MKANRYKVRLGSIVFWLLAWEAAGRKLKSDLLLPLPEDVLKRLCVLSVQGTFWGTIGRSLLRIMEGFLLGTAIGVLVGVVCYRSDTAKKLLDIPLGFIKAAPLVSFIILAMLWLSKTHLSVFVCFVLVMPMTAGNIEEGLRSMDKNLIEVTQTYRFSFGKKLKALYIPEVKPFFLAAMEVTLGFAFKAGIAGEVLATPPGTIGSQIYSSKIYLETVDLFAWTLVTVALSIGIEKCVKYLFRKAGA